MECKFQERQVFCLFQSRRYRLWTHRDSRRSISEVKRPECEINNSPTSSAEVKKDHHHYVKHQGLDPLIRSVSRFTAARVNASSVFQLFSFLVVCSGMISKGLDFVVFFASVKASSVCIQLSCLVCL